MRYLNRIVFINSARVNYADIPVDGNVHFIGTQGVGKSTVLRALLFFYNADKMKLGISKEKKSFDEYYFPYANSYVIYEVKRDEGCYLVMAFRSQGRACFRFLDIAYDKDFFISPEGRAFDGWDQIREALGRKVYYSRKIEKYEEYRNIIFGNNKGLPPEFRKFAITESSQYQNIPRTIQNVFLNSKLEASFIKDTIIMSLSEENATIDLSQYADHLKGFEEEYKDISLWHAKDRNGNVLVRKQAEKVIDVHRTLLYHEQERKELSHELNFAYRLAGEELPVRERHLSEQQEKLRKTEMQLSELANKYQEKKIQIVSDIKQLNEKLRQAREQKKRYEQLNITEIEQRVNARESVAGKKAGLEEQLRVLTDRFTHIRQKFALLEEQEKAQFTTFKNTKETEVIGLRQRLFEKKEQLLKQQEQLIREIKEQEEEKVNSARGKIDRKKEELSALAIRKVEIGHQVFYEKEIRSSKEEQAALQGEIKEDMLKKETCNRRIKSTTREWELEGQALERETASAQKELSRRIEEADRHIAEIATLLKSRQGSLYEWLNREYPRWEDTIGKVIDEKQVLFHTGLSPQLMEKISATLYGVKLDLSGIGKVVKTIGEYEEEQQELRTQLQELKKQFNDLSVRKEEEAVRLKKKYQPLIKADKEEVIRLDYRNEQHQKKLQQLAAALITWQQKAADEKAVLLLQVEEQVRCVTAQRMEAEEEWQKSIAVLDKRIKAKEKEFRQRVKEETEQVETATALLHAGIAAAGIKLKETLVALQQEYAKELTGEGADTSRITMVTDQIGKLENELRFIEDNRTLVIEYRKDKRELIDRMDEFRNDKQLKEKELAGEQEKYEQKRLSLVREAGEQRTVLDDLNRLLEELREDIRRTKEFCQQEDCPVELLSGAEKETGKRCKILVEDLIRNHYRIIEWEKDLREAVNRFTGNFSEQNTFHFRTRLTTQDDFMDFASELTDFIDNDKIAEFEQRSNKAYTDIIRQIGKEVSDMMSREGAIQKVINDINDDFVERNFAGVIKSIALRAMPSENKIMQLMQTIRDFNEEHLFSLGSFDLFSGSAEKQEENNRKAVGYLQSLVKELSLTSEKELTLSDTFDLQFRIVENDNDSGWVEKLANVGSDGTDVLVKAMINIMLLNVFKEKASRRFSDFRLHCMMDEIGKLHPNNIQGILNFANSRNILLVNCSPTSYRATDYRYTYILNKDSQNITVVKRLIRKEAES